MQTLEEPPKIEINFDSNERIADNTISKSFSIGTVTKIAIGIILLVIVSAVYIQKATEEEKNHFAYLENKVANRESLSRDEKLEYYRLLKLIKGIDIYSCDKNFNQNIGSITGYEVSENDLDLRNSGKSFEDALKEAFRRTGVPIEEFYETKFVKDKYGKSRTVVWKNEDGAEVNIDAPHELNGPDVFHIGYQTPGKKNKIVGHIFIDCAPYFRSR